jgi:hypothetical protein
MLTAIAYRITREDNNEVLFEGIVTDIYDCICPAQESRWLTEEFPDLPSECEIRHFNVKGLKLDMRSFSIPWQMVLDNPAPKF